jgi:hypothetical protein
MYAESILKKKFKMSKNPDELTRFDGTGLPTCLPGQPYILVQQRYPPPPPKNYVPPSNGVPIHMYLLLIMPFAQFAFI